MAEQQKLLQGTVVGVASGTPNRLCKLADLDALKLDHLQLLVLDVHLDAKQRWAAIYCMSNDTTFFSMPVHVSRLVQHYVSFCLSELPKLSRVNSE